MWLRLWPKVKKKKPTQKSIIESVIQPKIYWKLSALKCFP